MSFYPGAYGVYGDKSPRFGEHAALSRNIGPGSVCKYLNLTYDKTEIDVL